MKRLILLTVLLLCSFFSQAQDIAMMLPASYSFVSLAQPQSTHHRSKLASAGTWTMLGGVAVAVVGYIEYKGATKNDGPFTVVNVGQQVNGTALEVVGGLGVVAGLTMVIIGSAHQHAHHDSKVSIYAPRPNEIGIACKL